MHQVQVKIFSTIYVCVSLVQICLNNMYYHIFLSYVLYVVYVAKNLTRKVYIFLMNSISTSAKALAITKPEVTDEKSSSDETILMSAESLRTYIKIGDLDHKQTAKKTGPQTIPRELRLIKTSVPYRKEE